MISADSINNIHNISIVDIVASRVKLKNKKACCPFHNEKTESFSVHTAKNIFKCFGCGEAGNGISFIMKHDRLSFVDAIEKLGSEHGVNIYYDKEYNAEALAQKKEYLNSATEVLQYVHKMYAKQDKTLAIKYLEDREFTDDVVVDWDIMYAPDDWRYITPSIVDKGCLSIANDLGYVVSKDMKNFDMYRNRIIIPIHDAFNNLVGFAGRIISDEQPKYLNPKDSAIYLKGKVLFGLNKAKEAIKESGYAILMEGYFDVIRSHISGHANAVSPCGTACSDEQLKLLKQYTNKVVVWYDGDKTGQTSTEKRVAQLLAMGLEASVINVQGMDPDEYFKSMHNEQN